MFKETIEYDVPKVRELAEEFKAAARVHENGKKIEVGRFTAHKLGFLGQKLGFLFFSLADGQNLRWRVDVKESTQALKRGSILLFCSDMNQDALIDMLACLEAEEHITEEDKKEPLRQALAAKLQQLGPK